MAHKNFKKRKNLENFEVRKFLHKSFNYYTLNCIFLFAIDIDLNICN